MHAPLLSNPFSFRPTDNRRFFSCSYFVLGLIINIFIDEHNVFLGTIFLVALLFLLSPSYSRMTFQLLRAQELVRKSSIRILHMPLLTQRRSTHAMWKCGKTRSEKRISTMWCYRTTHAKICILSTFCAPHNGSIMCVHLRKCVYMHVCSFACSHECTCPKKISRVGSKSKRWRRYKQQRRNSTQKCKFESFVHSM